MKRWASVGPILGGALFWLTVLADHWLYRNQMIGVGGAGLMEAAALLIALVLFACGLKAIAGFSRAKQPVAALLTICSLVIGIILLIRGFSAGAALLTAT